MRKKQLHPAPSISWCSLPDLDHGNGLGKGTQKKTHGECVGGEDNLSASQRCCSHRLALPASEVSGSISVTYVREDFAHSG